MVETGLGLSTGQGVKTMDGIETLIRAGIGKGIELRATPPNLLRSSSINKVQGADSGIGTKVHLPSLGKFHFATGVNLSLPTGSAGVSSGGWDPSVLLSTSLVLTSRLSSSTSAVFGWVGNGSVAREKDLQFALDESWNATKTVTPFVEWAPFISSTAHNSGYTAQAGATWQVRPHLQFDARLGVLVKDAQKSTLAGLGYSLIR